MGVNKTNEIPYLIWQLQITKKVVNITAITQGFIVKKINQNDNLIRPNVVILEEERTKKNYL